LTVAQHEDAGRFGSLLTVFVIAVVVATWLRWFQLEASRPAKRK